MSVYSDILKRSYFDGSTGKALQNFADQSGSSALDTDCVRPNTGTSSDARRTGGTFYDVQVGALETQEFRTTPVPFWLVCFSDTITGR